MIQDYQTGATGPHTQNDLPVMAAMREYLLAHSPEHLLRCVASAAIDAQNDTEATEKIHALGWLASQTNLLADGNIVIERAEIIRLRELEASLKKSPGRPRIETDNPKTLAQRKWREKKREI